MRIKEFNSYLKKRFVNFSLGSITEPSEAVGFDISMVAIIVAITSQIDEFTKSAPGQRLQVPPNEQLSKAGAYLEATLPSSKPENIVARIYFLEVCVRYQEAGRFKCFGVRIDFFISGDIPKLN